MPIRPIDVRRKEFRSGFRGYDANQVDDFLDAVADEFERTYTEGSRLREEVSSLRERLEQFEELEGSIRSALVHAEQSANDLRRTATWEADDVRKSAAREADLTIREAKARAHQMLAETSGRLDRIQESYDALQEAKRGFTNDFRQLLKTYTEVMENMEVSSAKEIEASLRQRLDTESIAVAHEAASQEPEYEGPVAPEAEAAEPPSDGLVADAASAEDDAATRRFEPEAAAEPTPEEIDSEIAELEATEPEMDPAAAEGPVAEEPVAEEPTPDEPGPEESAASEEAGEQPAPESEITSEQAVADESTPADEPAAEEVNREEPTLAEEKDSDTFFDREQAEGASQQDESRIFRASRFLRRRE